MAAIAVTASSIAAVLRSFTAALDWDVNGCGVTKKDAVAAHALSLNSWKAARKAAAESLAAGKLESGAPALASLCAEERERLES